MNPQWGIEKKTSHVIIFTEQNRIEGTAHHIGGENYTSDNRLVDLMNYGAKRFIVITDVKVFNLQGELLYTSEFLILNKDFMVLVFEKEAISSSV